MSRGLERQDVRLDKFLRGQLSGEVYERLVCSEPCVLSSSEERRVHRYAVLGHRCLYSTEFPPKNFKALLNLEDIVAVDLLDDLPDFLSGDEQRNTVHVQVHYTRATPTKGRKFFGSRKSPRPLPGDPPAISPRMSLEKEMKRLSPTTGRTSPGLQYLELPAIAVHPSSPRGPLAATGGWSLPVGPQRSPPISPLAQTEGQSSPVSPQSPQAGRGGGKSPFSTRSKLEITHNQSVGGGRKGWGKDEVESPFLQEIPLPPSPAAGHRVEYSQSTKLGSSSSKSLTPHSTRAREETQLKSASSLKHLTSSSLIPLSQLLSYQDRTVSQPNLHASTAQPRHQASAAPPHRASSSGVLSSSLSLPPSPLPSKLNTESAENFVGSGYLSNLGGSGNLGLEKLSHLGGSGNQLNQLAVEEEQGGAEVAVLDVYILKEATNFYHLLKGLWVDARINQVLQSELNSPAPQTKGSPKPYEQFCQHFISLKEELFAAKGLDTLAELAQELCTATQKYFIIKKLFWEDSELLDFFSRQLHLHLVGGSGSSNTTTTTTASTSGTSYSSSYDRVSNSSSTVLEAKLLENSIEYAIIILDVLYQMLKEAHSMLKKKLLCLTSNSGQHLLVLARATVGGFQLTVNIGHTQREEFTEKACGVMYELLLVCEQCRWPLARRTSISTSWLVETLSSSGRTRMRDFFSVVLAYVSHTISGALKGEGQTLVTLYQASVILHTFLNSSQPMLHFFKKRFSEEFKYYVSISKGRQVSQHPLIQNAIELLNSCKSKILSTR